MSITDQAVLAAYRNRSRISWSAVLAGAIVAVATSLLLSLLGAAIGAGSINPLTATSTDLANYGTGAGIWQIINFALSMALGGYVAARLSGTHSHLDAELHGLTTWGVAILLGSLLLAQAFSGLAGTVGQAASSLMSGSAGSAGASAGLEITPQAMIDRLQQSLGSSGDPTTMSREQIGTEIKSLIGSGVLDGSLSEPDRNRLISLVAAQAGATREEAARRVTQMENDAKAAVSRVEQRTRAAAATVADNAAAAARALFTGLTLGLLSALVGAWIGTRHKRALHPVAGREHFPEVPAYRRPEGVETAATAAAYTSSMPASGARAAYDRVEPSNVRVVYDDDDHLVSQYLEGVSFPLSKQELLGLARRGNAGPGLLRSIEGMAEGNYANTNEVIRALGMTHH